VFRVRSLLARHATAIMVAVVGAGVRTLPDLTRAHPAR